MDFTSMDPQTAKVAIQMQLADIAELLDSLYSDDVLPEGQVLVIKILKDEYKERIAFKKLLEDGKQEISDHQLAMKLAGLPVGPADAKFGADYEAQLCEAKVNDQEEQWEMAKDLYVYAFEGMNRGGSKASVEGRAVQPVVANRAPLHGIRSAPAGQLHEHGSTKILGFKAMAKCNACMEIVPSKNTLCLQCSLEPHTYCRACLLDLFTSAITNPTLFPPRCCKMAIPLDTCRIMLPQELIKDFDLKVEELATPNPTYCANADCSKFVRPKDIVNGVGTCVFCKRKTCVQCKSQEHSGLCPSDPHVQLLMDAAKRSKWQQCTKTRCNRSSNHIRPNR